MILDRKGKPFTFTTPSKDWAIARGVDMIPGVEINDRGQVSCTRDALGCVARTLEQIVTPEQVAPYDTVVPSDWPGLARYSERILPSSRVYQPPASYFVAARKASLECDPMRMGKNMMTLGGLMIAGAKKVLIATLGTPKLGWAEDVARWCGEWALMLDGRTGNDAWWFCVHCNGKGFIGGPRGTGARCDTCRGRGWLKITSPAEALERAKFVIVNYDILIGQKASNPWGVVRVRLDMLGWAAKIAQYYKPDAVILDEAHRIGKKGWRRESVRSMCTWIDRVVAVTGTPTDGNIVNMWYILDTITSGGWGKSIKRFAARYAGGFQGEWGFTVPKRGRSPLADTELPERLAHLMIRRERRELAPHLKPVEYQIVRVESGKRSSYEWDAPTDEAIERCLDATAQVKIPSAVEMIVDQIKEGCKVACFTRHINTGKEIADQVKRIVRSPRNRSAFAEVSADVWDCIGKGYDTRVEMADKFSAHEGAGLFQATVDGFQMGRSLKGISFSHFPDLHTSGDAILQCSSRGDDFDRSIPLVTMFYALEGSPDDHLLSVLVPKLEAMENVVGDREAGAVRDALAPRELLEQAWARHTAHLKGIE